MPQPDILALPFAHRKMLDFEGGTQFGLRVTHQSHSIINIVITGATKAGVFTYKLPTVGDRVIYTQDFGLSDVPIWITAAVDDNTYLPGTTFCRVDLLANGDVLQGLCSGYIDGVDAVSWPQTNLKPAVPNWGQIYRDSGTDPAANTEATYTIPDNLLGYIRSIHVRLVTDANVANRRVHMTLAIGATVMYDFFGTIDQTAGQTIDYFFIPNGAVTDELDNSKIVVPIPTDLRALDGWTLSTATLNRQAGDNFGAMDVLMERFFTGY